MSNTKATTAAVPKVRRRQPIETRSRLISAARELFGAVGYHAAGTHEIVGRAHVSRGALRHHFPEKRDLFEAVFVEVTQELGCRVRDVASGVEQDLWKQVIFGFTTYLDLVVVNEPYRRIMLIDGPAVLGWEGWVALQSNFVAADIQTALRLLMDDGIVRRRPEAPLAFLIQAALNDAALSIAHAREPREASLAATDAFVFLIEGLREPRTK